MAAEDEILQPGQLTSPYKTATLQKETKIASSKVCHGEVLHAAGRC
jgi:hypothetical protein